VSLGNFGLINSEFSVIFPFVIVGGKIAVCGTMHALLLAFATLNEQLACECVDAGGAPLFFIVLPAPDPTGLAVCVTAGLAVCVTAPNGLDECVTAGLAECVTAGLAECVTAGLVECVTAGLAECVTAGLVECVAAGLAECVTAGLAECVTAGLDVCAPAPATAPATAPAPVGWDVVPLPLPLRRDFTSFSNSAISVLS